MPNQSIGITATELFACNPYRILGVAVNASQAEIDKRYAKLLAMAETGSADSFKTPFDFNSLPPFSRTASSLKTAYAKLASNGYRCFAYADSDLTVALNIDDVALNLRGITCYDCFLRCYMWLVINDREMEEHELWIQLASYIDKMITSSPDQWEKLFDDRFPQAMMQEKNIVLKSFYTTFCEIILLPLKEMVRGSMKCQTALDILKAKGIDVNEEFPYIDIPQANKPKNGEPEPKLKIAVKDGEEYFDISTGKMISFESDSSDIESNTFAEAAAPITADELMDESEDIDEPEEAYEEEPEQAPQEDDDSGFVKRRPITFQTMRNDDDDDEDDKLYKFNTEPATPPAQEEAVEEAAEEPAEEAFEQPVEAEPAPVEEAPQPAAPKKNIFAAAAEKQERTAPKLMRKPVAAPTETAPAAAAPKLQRRPPVSAEQPAEDKPVIKTAPQLRKRPAQAAESPAPVQTAPKLMKKKTALVEDERELLKETADINLTEDAEEDENNLYTAALIQMLRSNRSKHQMMKDVDTRHVFNNGDNLEQSGPTELTMETINMKKYDSSRLASPFETEDRGNAMTLEEKYRNIKIDDMLNPTLGGKSTRTTFEPDAIEQFKKNKEAKKSATRKMLKTSLVIAAAFIIVILLKIFEII